MPITPDQCPLCGGPNGCQMAAGTDTAQDCWCSRTRIPRAVLDQIAPDRRGEVCVCARCATPRLPASTA